MHSYRLGKNLEAHLPYRQHSVCRDYRQMSLGSPESSLFLASRPGGRSSEMSLRPRHTHTRENLPAAMRTRHIYTRLIVCAKLLRTVYSIYRYTQIGAVQIPLAFRALSARAALARTNITLCVILLFRSRR